MTLLMSCHSSPLCRLATFVSRITPPLRSTFITKASALLRATPPLIPASVFFLMVSAICHFPSHPGQGSHVPYQSLCRVHAAFTPTAIGSVSRFRPDCSRRAYSAALLTVPCSTNDASSDGSLSLIYSTHTCRPFRTTFPRSLTTTPFGTQQHRAV